VQEKKLSGAIVGFAGFIGFIGFIEYFWLQI